MVSSTRSLRENKKDFVEKLLTRGVESVVDFSELRKLLLSGKRLRVKHGIDPTGPKIHLGRASTLRKLRAFQDLGHKIVLIVGDFTARVGDSSDKLEKRPMLTAVQIKQNLRSYRKQLGRIIDLSKAEIHFNSQWLKKLSFQEIAELAESFSVQQMLARRNFKERYAKGEEISLREFLYPLMQGYDSVAVKADVEVGGSDQLFNLIAGRVIQRHYGQKEQNILTTKMLDGTDGRKMSTSWGNVINIIDEPNNMFGKVMSANDELISQYALLCTDIPEEIIAENERRIKMSEVNPRDIKFELATEIVAIYHGQRKAQRAGTEFIRVFSEKGLPSISPPIRVVTGVNHTVSSILTATGIVSSVSAANRLIEQGGVRIDGERILNPREKIEPSLKPRLFQVGKRRFFRFKIKGR